MISACFDINGDFTDSDDGELGEVSCEERREQMAADMSRLQWSTGSTEVCRLVVHIIGTVVIAATILHAII